MSPDRPTKRLGELLVERTLITQAQLEQALTQQRSTKEFLGAILVRLGFIQPEGLLTMLSQQFNMPHEPLPVERVNWTIAKQFPASMFSDGKCFPIRADADSVTVAIANPLDAWALSAVEKVAGFRKVKPVLVLERELQDTLRAYRQQSLNTIEERFNDDAHRQTD